MYRGLKPAADNLALVLTRPSYLGLTVLSAFVFYALNAFFSQFDTILSAFSLLGFGGSATLAATLIAGYYEVVPVVQFAALLCTAVLFGILLSLMWYKVTVVGGRASGSWLGSIGVLIGVIAPSCAACGVGLLSVLGLSAAVATLLPFKGVELSLLAIALLLIAIFSTATNLLVCRVRR